MQPRYTFLPAREPEDLARCFALRHEVYSVEKGWEPLRRSDLEFDPWDHFSDHVLALGADGSTVGTARLVYDWPLGLPADAVAVLPGGVERGNLCAVGRLVVAKPERGQQFLVLMGLSRLLMHAAHSRRKTTWCAFLEAPVLEALEFLGMEPCSQGEPVPHHGTARILVTGSIDQLCEVLFSPEIDRLLTEQEEDPGEGAARRFVANCPACGTPSSRPLPYDFLYMFGSVW
jgi:predicted GNAT family N-acyltransferase